MQLLRQLILLIFSYKFFIILLICEKNARKKNRIKPNKDKQKKRKVEKYFAIKYKEPILDTKSKK